MKITFIVYHDELEDRVDELLEKANIHIYTEWVGVKGRLDEGMPHMGTRIFPGFNCVRMIAFENEDHLEELIKLITNLNEELKPNRQMIRLFQIPLEKVI